MEKKIAVYTAIFGDYDDLIEPKYPEIKEQADFFCFTDNEKLTSNFYTVIQVPTVYTELVRNSRFLKVSGHKVLNQYKYTVWLDAAYQLKIRSFETLLKSVAGDTPMATFIHSERNCLYREAQTCITYKKDFNVIIFSQMMKYLIRGMPKDFGLFETGILVKNMSSPLLAPLVNNWQKEINRGSKRDQLSLPFVLWKTGITPGILEGKALANAFADHNNHKFYFYHYKKSLIHSILNTMNRSSVITRSMQKCLNLFQK